MPPTRSSTTMLNRVDLPMRRRRARDSLTVAILCSARLADLSIYLSSDLSVVAGAAVVDVLQHVREPLLECWIFRMQPTPLRPSLSADIPQQPLHPPPPTPSTHR